MPVDKNEPLPVFVTPLALHFYVDDESTHKQVFTILNPYDFDIRYKVLSTRRENYHVVEPYGRMAKRSVLDIVLRHTRPTRENCNTVDKFRVDMQEIGKRTYSGSREFTATLLPGKPPVQRVDAGEPDRFEDVQEVASGRAGRTRRHSVRGRDVDAGHGESVSLMFLGLVVFVVSITAMCLPTVGDKDTVIPEYLHLGVTQKLAFAFALGMVVCFALKS